MSLRKCNFLYVELLRIDLSLQMRFNSAKPYKNVMIMFKYEFYIRIFDIYKYFEWFECLVLTDFN